MHYYWCSCYCCLCYYLQVSSLQILVAGRKWLPCFHHSKGPSSPSSSDEQMSEQPGDLERGYALFSASVWWCEQHPLCSRYLVCLRCKLCIIYWPLSQLPAFMEWFLNQWLLKKRAFCFFEQLGCCDFSWQFQSGFLIVVLVRKLFRGFLILSLIREYLVWTIDYVYPVYQMVSQTFQVVLSSVDSFLVCLNF